VNTAISLGLSVLMVIALVNLLKGIGLSGKWSALVAVVIGVALAVADFVFGSTGLYVAAIGGLKIGLGAAGLYDVTTTPPANVTVNGASVGAVTKAVVKTLQSGAK
jgi:flagellar biosynthesis protein FliR